MPRSRFASSALFLFALPAPLFASGCIGCDNADAYCDESGCYVCDSFGCRPVDSTPSGSGGGVSGTGGSTTSSADGGGSTTGTGGASTGGAGQGGAEPSCDPAVVICPCGPTGTCDGGLECVDGKCLSGCGFDYECGPGKVCGDGACVPGCDASLPCADGFACVGGGCLPDPTDPQCTTAGDCGGLACVDGFCAAACATNAQCPTGQLCDATSGTCFTDTTPKPLCGPSQTCPGVGQKCLADGYCHYECTTLTQCKLVDARFEGCDMGVCKTAAELSPECTLGDPCPQGQVCVSNACVQP